MSGRLRVAFFGTPDYAVPTLAALAREHEVVVVVARPDRPAGRGREVGVPPTIVWARNHGIPTEQPERPKGDDAFAHRLASADLDVAVTVAYGAILPQPLLDIPRHGFLNAHASLLPAYRGAAPIQRALIDGVEETGITIMQTERGLDTGPIRWVEHTRFLPQETSTDAFVRLSHLSAEAMRQALRRLAAGTLDSVPQDGDAATYAPMLVKEDGRIRWADDATAIERRYRGVHAWPGSFTSWRGSSVKVDGVASVEGNDSQAEAPGTVVAIDGDAIVVACGRGRIRIGTVTPPGKRTMMASAWSHGHGPKVGDVVA